MKNESKNKCIPLVQVSMCIQALLNIRKGDFVFLAVTNINVILIESRKLCSINYIQTHCLFS